MFIYAKGAFASETGPRSFKAVTRLRWKRTCLGERRRCFCVTTRALPGLTLMCFVGWFLVGLVTVKPGIFEQLPRVVILSEHFKEGRSKSSPGCRWSVGSTGLRFSRSVGILIGCHAGGRGSTTPAEPVCCTTKMAARRTGRPCPCPSVNQKAMPPPCGWLVSPPTWKTNSTCTELNAA